MPATPASSTRLLQAFDPDAMRSTLQRGRFHHVQLEAGRFSGRLANTRSAELAVDWGEYSLAVHAAGDLAPDRLTLGLLVDGCGDWRFFGQRCGHGSLLLLPAAGELQISLPGGAHWFSLQLPEQRLDALGLSPPRGLGLCLDRPLGPALRQGLVELAAALAPCGRPPAGADLLLAQEDLVGLMAGELGRRLAEGQRRPQPSSHERQRVLRRALQHLRDSGDPRLRIAALCTAAHTSLATLERAFHEAYGLSPQRFLRLSRLTEVRRELLRGQTGSVTAAATRWGFFHLGRFAALYARQFGESPSQTLASRPRQEF